MRMKKYNYAIDFWKVIFCYIIVCLHSNNFINQDISWFKGGAIGVEFFFIVTGILMNQSLEHSHEDTTFSFIYKKVLKLFPYVFITSLIIFVEKIYINKWGLSQIITLGIKMFFSELTFTRFFGFSKELWGINGASWYLSVMILAIILLYPLLKLNRKAMSETCFPIISILLIGYLIQTHGTILVIDQYSYFTFDGLKRAIAEICFGCTLYSVCNYIKNKNFTHIGVVTLSILELFGYFFTILFAWKNYEDISVIILLFLGISICITFSQIGILTIIINKIINTKYLSKFAISLFLSHMEIMEIFRYKKIILEDYNYIKVTVFYLLICTLVSIINIMIIDIITICFNKFKRGNIFVVK